MSKYPVEFDSCWCPKITDRTRFEKIEEIVLRDHRLLCTMLSYTMSAIIFVNASLFRLGVIGLVASVLYFLINAVFLGNAFFPNENRFIKFMLGSLLLIVFIGLISWAVMMIFNLDIIRSTIALCVAATLSSAVNKIRGLGGEVARYG